jgi:hypothetical protein
MDAGMHNSSSSDRHAYWLRGVLGWLKVLFTPVAMGFLLYFGWHARHTLAAVFVQAKPGPLGVAVLLWVVLHLLSPLLPAMIFRAWGFPMGYARAFKIHAQRLPGRYLPGGIWHTVGRMVDYHGHGIPRRHLAAYVFLETAFPPAVTLLLGGIGLAVFRGMDEWGIAGLGAAIAAAAGIAFLPAVINRHFLKPPDRLPARAYYGAAATLCVYWSVAAAAFVCYMAAFPAVLTDTAWFQVAATYLFSWGVGYLAIFAPQGIGVFEFVAGKLLTAPISLGGMAALMAGFRLVVLAADVIIWSVSRLR